MRQFKTNKWQQSKETPNDIAIKMPNEKQRDNQAFRNIYTIYITYLPYLNNIWYDGGQYALAIHT